MFFWHGKAQASAMQQQVETHLQQVQPVQVIQFLYLPETGVLAWGVPPEEGRALTHSLRMQPSAASRQHPQRVLQHRHWLDAVTWMLGVIAQ